MLTWSTLDMTRRMTRPMESHTATVSFISSSFWHHSTSWWLSHTGTGTAAGTLSVEKRMRISAWTNFYCVVPLFLFVLQVNPTFNPMKLSVGHMWLALKTLFNCWLVATGAGAYTVVQCTGQKLPLLQQVWSIMHFCVLLFCSWTNRTNVLRN